MSHPRTVILEIKSCYKCPYYRANDMCINEIEYCERNGKKLETISDGIPSWCPLPEKKNE